MGEEVQGRPLPAGGGLFVLNILEILEALGCVENLYGDERAFVVVVHDHTGIRFVALLDLAIRLKDYRYRIYFSIVSDFHDSSLQYFAILLVMYAVTITGLTRSMSTKTRRRKIPSPVVTLDCATILPC